MAKAPSERHQSPGEFAIESAGAVQMSAPPWVTGAPPPTALDDVEDGRAEPQPVPAPRGRSDRDEESAGGEWHEPAYFARPGPSLNHRISVGFAILLFLAAPIALLVALVVH